MNTFLGVRSFDRNITPVCIHVGPLACSMEHLHFCIATASISCGIRVLFKDGVAELYYFSSAEMWLSQHRKRRSRLMQSPPDVAARLIVVT
jgi:hypothetical protein